jgi:hypothetical protein
MGPESLAAKMSRGKMSPKVAFACGLPVAFRRNLRHYRFAPERVVQHRTLTVTLPCHAKMYIPNFAKNA